MVDIAVFPTIQRVLYTGGNTNSYIAGATILPGQLVAFAASGASMTVVPAVNGVTGQPVGVAIGRAEHGEEVAIAEDGCIVYVVNADDTITIDAGDALEDSDNVVGGTVSTLATSGGAAVKYRAGFAIDDIAGGGVGRMKVSVGLVTSMGA